MLHAKKGGSKIKKVVLVVVSVLMLAIGMQQIGLVMGCRDEGKMPAGPNAAASFFIDSSLTTSQREQIAALWKKHFLAITPLRQRLGEAMFEYRQTQVLQPHDKAALTAKGKAVEEARQALRLKATEFRAEFLKLLTPEQQAKLHDAGFGMWGARKGRGHGSGCGRW